MILNACSFTWGFFQLYSAQGTDEGFILRFWLHFSIPEHAWPHPLVKVNPLSSWITICMEKVQMIHWFVGNKILQFEWLRVVQQWKTYFKHSSLVLNVIIFCCTFIYLNSLDNPRVPMRILYILTNWYARCLYTQEYQNNDSINSWDIPD